MPVEVRPRAAVTVDAAMEIVLGEIRVRFGPGFDPGALRRLLEVLAEPAC